MRLLSQPLYAIGQATAAFTRVSSPSTATATAAVPIPSFIHPIIASNGDLAYGRRKTHHLRNTVACFSSSTSIQDGDDTVQEDDFSSSYHSPVMWKECIDALLKRSHQFSKKNKKYKKRKKGSEHEEHQSSVEDSSSVNGNRTRTFVDGTLGGGGHSQYLLQNLSAGDVLIGCDVDPSALTTASIRLKDYIVDSKTRGGDGNHESSTGSSCWDKPIFVPVQTNFANAERSVRDLRHPLTGGQLVSAEGVDGILLDLGVSSHQIDNADRGFAFMKDGPLDMRMSAGSWMNQDEIQQMDDITSSSIKDSIQNKISSGRSSGGLTAADIVNEFPVEELTRILRDYGDEPRAWKIANAIIMSRPLSTTGDLKEAVSKVTPEFAKKGRRLGRKATLARVFQSLRIVVNDEDGVLRQALEDMAPALVKKGGRLVVLSYHSMEDRATKRVMRDGTVANVQRRIEKDIYGNDIGGSSLPWKSLGKQKATDEEVEKNSRARSATLRVAERI